jgi:hypothetical protein
LQTLLMLIFMFELFIEISSPIQGLSNKNSFARVCSCIS